MEAVVPEPYLSEVRMLAVCLVREFAAGFFFFFFFFNCAAMS